MWTDKAVSSNGGLTICGAYEWEISQTDGDLSNPNKIAWDNTLFTLDLLARTINVFTEDFSKAATYPMQVKVWYTELP